jgi:hypothetical protein
LLVKPYASFQILPGLNIVGVGAVSLIDGLDQVRPMGFSGLPRVRSDLELYQSSTGGFFIDEIEANYHFNIAPDWFGRVSAGIFEEMFGGVAAEVLYRPVDSRLAFSLNVNRVRQREFKQMLGFRDYEVTTGHLTTYYRSPWYGINVKASVGSYLAGDRGCTLDISRRFETGAEIGAFATRTNVSAEQFGEGSFDKGFYLRIPLSTFGVAFKGNANFDYRFLTRDGGAKVNDGVELYTIAGPHTRYDAFAPP